jgi:maltose alpha-D-glucosyltransferase/alpha-amylase
MPGVPFLYYGDEIGMRYRTLTSKEGGYQRTGSRTPMQWNAGTNLGFSTADAADLYLPVDATYPINVEGELLKEDSLINVTKRVIKLRHEEKSLHADGDFEILLAEPEKPFVFKRGDLILIANPSEDSFTLPKEISERVGNVAFSVRNEEFDGKEIRPQEFYVCRVR